MSGIFVVFLKPKQEEQDVAVETLDYQQTKLDYQKKELNDALILKHEFLFEAFTVGSKTKTSAGGRGVGLALCKQVIELHQGRIWAKPNNTKGTSFFIKLPI